MLFIGRGGVAPQLLRVLRLVLHSHKLLVQQLLLLLLHQHVVLLGRRAQQALLLLLLRSHQPAMLLLLVLLLRSHQPAVLLLLQAAVQPAAIGRLLSCSQVRRSCNSCNINSIRVNSIRFNSISLDSCRDFSGSFAEIPEILWILQWIFRDSFGFFNGFFKDSCHL